MGRTVQGAHGADKSEGTKTMHEHKFVKAVWRLAPAPRSGAARQYACHVRVNVHEH